MLQRLSTTPKVGAQARVRDPCVAWFPFVAHPDLKAKKLPTWAHQQKENKVPNERCLIKARKGYIVRPCLKKNKHPKIKNLHKKPKEAHTE